jgi:hypothetical protein
MHAANVGHDATSKKHGHEVRTNSQAVTTMIRGWGILSDQWPNKGAPTARTTPPINVATKPV